MLSTERAESTMNELPSDEELHAIATQHIAKANQLLFQQLPQIMSQIINQEIWKKRNVSYNHFGEYALSQAPEGLGISSNEMLWLLRSTLDIKTHHAAHWGDVLGEVETVVRTYAKEKNIPIKELNKDLTESDNHAELFQENRINYLPSRSKSIDGQLVKLKKKDPEAYSHVVEGRMELKEAWPQILRKKLQPIESVKNKFTSLSKEDREAFLAWVEQEKENLS